MISFPNCKINLGLNIVAKRSDGFHDIETVFYPVQWCDALEIIVNTEDDRDFVFSSSGKKIEGTIESNLIYKAYQSLKSRFNLPNIKVHLHKNIPMGAGLGGGSADAAFFIRQINDMFVLGMNTAEQATVAGELGSDCAFFSYNTPVYATGKGNVFTTVNIDLSEFYLLLVFPAIHSDTKEAYGGISVQASRQTPKEIIETMPVSAWKDSLQNDFEFSIFAKYPAIAQLKDELYQVGAIYAGLSGSGSAVFGIFEKSPNTTPFEKFEYFLQSPAQKRV
jgi:4-diphosphocytidyl-2-C-methyl-D-erythritol kinase